MTDDAMAVDAPAAAKIPLIFSTNEKVNLPIFFSKPCAPDFGNDETSRPESVDWALERHGRRKRPWWTQCRVRQSYDDLWLKVDFACSLISSSQQEV